MYIKSLHRNESKKACLATAPLARQRIKHFIFYCEAKLFLKFNWQPASLVIRRFDVCFKNLAQTATLWARNPNKQCEKPRCIPGKLNLHRHCGPVWQNPSLHFSASLILYCPRKNESNFCTRVGLHYFTLNLHFILCKKRKEKNWGKTKKVR